MSTPMSLFAHRMGTFDDALGPSVHAAPYTIHHWYRDVRRKPSEGGSFDSQDASYH
jgi:hypothetical protein